MSLLGFIGTGNMAGALVKAAVQSVAPDEILLSNRTPEKAEALSKALGCTVGTNEDVAKRAKYVFLGVKPQMMEGVLTALRGTLAARTDRFILVSMAAGLTMERIAELAGGNYPVIRIMPNTPCAVGKGVILYDVNSLVTAEEISVFTEALAGAGLLDPLEERLIDAASAVAGCGPAFLCQIAEALADGGVACGLPRQKAILYAAQMIEGTGALLRATGSHPGVLKDQVCSPGGSTIAGVRVLEERGVRGALMGAVIAAEEKNRALGKK